VSMDGRKWVHALGSFCRDGLPNWRHPRNSIASYFIPRQVPGVLASRRSPPTRETTEQNHAASRSSRTACNDVTAGIRQNNHQPSTA
jgi:hypothetical protein